ncbi:unnamed protein product [Trifolium pratense]|uniref:Uncharacterized protein n=1 Tax=Trifolium pratense TaxID=57577 RepID=A0ACB0IPB2_TRIPR|nr:unnamed protein product [Trifolium pratense]
MDMMCQLKFQNISTLTQGMKTNNSNLIKFTQLLISVSLFSFIFSPTSLFVFLHYFKFYFSTLPFQLFTHNIDKNSMFLLCNGLLVFVGLTKSFSASSSDDDKSSDSSDDLSSSKYIEEEDKEEDCSQSHVLDVESNDLILVREDEKITSEPVEQNAVAEEEAEDEVEENIENIIFINDEEQEEEVELFDADDEEGDKGSENDYILIEENNIEEEEEESCISTEELNKKFEDFIRKMKEDLRIDARRHLIMV